MTRWSPKQWLWLCTATGLLILVEIVTRLDAPVALGGLALLACVVLMLLKPEVATVLFAALLYLNLAGIAVQRWALPDVVGAMMILLPLLLPLVRRMVLQRERLRVDKAFLLMLVFLDILLISSFVAVDYQVALRRIASFIVEGLAIYWLVLNVARPLKTWRLMAWAVVLACVLLSSLSLYQAVTHNYERQFGGLANRELNVGLIEKAAESGDGILKVYLPDRAMGPLDDPNRYAQILLVLLPVALFLWRWERRRDFRALALFSAGMILCGILLTYSRGAILALALLAGLLVWLRYLRLKHFVLGLAALAVLVVAVTPGVLERFSRLKGSEAVVQTNVTGEQNADQVVRGRLTEMLSAAMAFRDHVLLGVGPGQYMPFYSVRYQELPDIKFRDISGQRRAHSLYLEMAAETGIFGAFVFVAIPMVLLRGLARARRRWRTERPDLSDLATALALGIVGYLATGVFLHLAFERYFWFLLAISGAALQISRDEEIAVEVEVARPTVRRVRKTRVTVAA